MPTFTNSEIFLQNVALNFSLSGNITRIMRLLSLADFSTQIAPVGRSPSYNKGYTVRGLAPPTPPAEEKKKGKENFWFLLPRPPHQSKLGTGQAPGACEASACASHTDRRRVGAHRDSERTI